jgi:hypothetical protein
MKVTVDLDVGLYRAMKVQAARTDRSVRAVFMEAVESWLQRQEDAEDLASAEAALAEYERDGGVSADRYFRHLGAEARARYGSDSDPGTE